MENNHIHSGLFPALLEPAKAAAKELLGLGEERRKVDSGNGMWVVRKKCYTPSDGENIHEFEMDGETFVIFETY